MAAPRKYSDKQREAMYALYTQGITPVEITRRCAEGTAGTTAFEIPRRTAHSIVRTMDFERGYRQPQTRDEEPSNETVERLQKRLLRLAEREIERIERAQATGKPVDRNALHELGRSAKILGGGGSRGRPRSSAKTEPRRVRAHPSEPSFLERLEADWPPENI